MRLPYSSRPSSAKERCWRIPKLVVAEQDRDVTLLKWQRRAAAVPRRAETARPLYEQLRDAPQRCAAFSVVEMLVAVAIMTLIVFGLYKMFDQTQRALRSNITQTDVLESGRAAMELVSRELEQMAPSGIRYGTNFVATLAALPDEPLVQSLMGGNEVRTNVVQDVFFLSRLGHEVTGTGYRVLFASNGVGTLSRFSITRHVGLVTSSNLPLAFLRAFPTNFQKIASGVVHFRVSAYDQSGVRITSVNRPDQIIAVPEFRARSESRLYFMDKQMPAYLELELGYLEPPVADQAKSFPDRAVARRFLEKQAGKVHLFRQRIPVHTHTFTP